jgi:hypothetical protein
MRVDGDLNFQEKVLPKRDIFCHESFPRRLHPTFGAPLVAWLALLQLLPSFSAEFSGVTTIERLDWIPTAGLDLAFRVDGLRLL